MRISDWSSDVCSSDLFDHRPPHLARADRPPGQTGLHAGLQDAGVEPPGRTATCVIADAAPAVFFIHPPGFLPHAGEAPAFFWRSPSCPPSLAMHLIPRWTKRSEEHTSELQSLMRISYAVFCLKKK